MKKIVFLALFSIYCLGISCKNKKENPKKEYKALYTQEIKVHEFSTLEPLLHTQTDTTYIVNFWAMWCAPCVKELPYFEAYAKKNKDKKEKVLFVSLDFTKDIDSKLKPFLSKKNITSEVVLLNDPDANSWINKIDPNWSGGIPFTIIFNKKKREYHERTFESLEDLEETVHKTFIP